MPWNPERSIVWGRGAYQEKVSVGGVVSRSMALDPNQEKEAQGEQVSRGSGMPG